MMMKITKDLLLNLIEDEEGATAIEYALIAAILSVGLVTVLNAMGVSLRSVFTTISTTLNTAGGAGAGN